MKAKLPLVARILLGLVFFAAGITWLLGVVQEPTDLPESMKAFNAGLTASTYFMPFLKVTETVCGLLLLSGFFVPLALVVLAPITLNIFFVNAFMMPSGLPIVLVLMVLQAYLAFFAPPYAPTVRQLFRAK